MKVYKRLYEDNKKDSSREGAVTLIITQSAKTTQT
jgi:hypothetical protein